MCLIKTFEIEIENVQKNGCGSKESKSNKTIANRGCGKRAGEDKKSKRMKMLFEKGLTEELALAKNKWFNIRSH